MLLSFSYFILQIYNIPSNPTYPPLGANSTPPYKHLAFNRLQKPLSLVHALKEGPKTLSPQNILIIN